MKIGLISDTLVPGGAPEVPQEVIKAFQGVDLILHAGNIYATRVLDWLERIAPVKAAGSVHGDRFERPNSFSMEGSGDPRVAWTHILELEGHTVGLVNDMQLYGMSDEARPGIIEKHHLPDGKLPGMVEEFLGTNVDIVVFGRTMYALVEEHQGILFVNPGSPTLPKNLRQLGNVAIMELKPGSREAWVLDLADFS